MLIENSSSAFQVAPANVGLTAFQVVVMRAKELEKTLQQVSARQAQDAKEQKARAEEERELQRAAEYAAEQRGGVDVFVDGSDRSAAGGSGPQPDADSSGGKVDIEV